MTMPDPTPIPSCSACSEPIPDPAERWPDWGNGTVCQLCWEAQSSRLWWAMVRLLPEEERLTVEGRADAIAIPSRVPAA